MGGTAGRGRLRLLQIAIVLIAVVFAARLFQLQVLWHDDLAQQAQQQWKQRRVLPAERGGLYDRSGRPLALSVTRWRIGVASELVPTRAAQESLADTLAGCLRLDRREVARRLRNAAGAHVVLLREVVLAPAQLAVLERQTAVTREQLSSRVYPLDGIGASLLGFFREDSDGHRTTTGLEHGLDFHLAGEPGETWHLASPVPGRTLGDHVLRPPRHGHDLVLTLDADLQTVCEQELARWIEKSGARGGAILIIDPWQGDLLASASSPLIRERAREGGNPAVWNDGNFTGMYEPGSVFKLFTTAALLGRGAIDTSTTFDCSDPNLAGFSIRNAEEEDYGPLDLSEALVHSVNVFFARAVANLGPGEFYRDLAEFGFGQCTRLPYPGQAAGILATPDRWSGRTQATIAFGQEVAVTPLQMVMAVGALANGGWLYAPRLVREVRDHEGRLVERCPPVPLRRVASEGVARWVRRAMRRVVTEGTGRGADLAWLSLGGKTGTAQKDADGRPGYDRGRYVASFVACVPAAKPRLVVLTLLDEPDWAHLHAAQSAVPLCADLLQAIRRSTDWLTDVGVGDGSPEVVRIAGSATTRVPDLLFLPVATAERRARRAGLALGGGERSGRVIEQVPAAGAIVAAGSAVRVTVAADQGREVARGTLCPDLRGLSNREVLALAARMGLQIMIEGFGYVREQDPAPGSRLDGRGLVRVGMVAAW